MLAKKTTMHIKMSFSQKGSGGRGGFLLEEEDASVDSSVGVSSGNSLSIDDEVIMSRVSGQVVLEYVLMLSMALVIGVLLFKGLVGSATDPQGIRKAWVCMIRAIARDNPNKPLPPDTNPLCR